MMSETQPTAIAVTAEQVRPIPAGLLRVLATAVRQSANWAGTTAQQLGEIVSALMGPAIVCAYAFAAWSLAANAGWTNTFIFSSGPLSNWFVWLLIAALINLASSILRRHGSSERIS
jgi:hypothetical protein